MSQLSDCIVVIGAIVIIAVVQPNQEDILSNRYVDPATLISIFSTTKSLVDILFVARFDNC
jgi:hypothetical protein